MSAIDYKALAERVAQRAIYADNNADQNNKTWAADLRAIVSLLNWMADAQPVAWSDGLGSFIAADERVGDDPDILAYRVPLYAHPAPAAPAVAERGPWSADQRGRHVWVDSDDFTHDVRLVVNGDFESDDQKFAYAQEIARRLNAAPAAPQAEPKREPLSGDGIACLWSTAIVMAAQREIPDVQMFARLVERAHGIGGSDD